MSERYEICTLFVVACVFGLLLLMAMEKRGER